MSKRKHKSTKRGSKSFLVKYFRHPIEAIFSYLIYIIMRILPFSWVSGIGGYLGRHLFIKIGSTKTATENLKLVFPKMKKEKREKLIVDIWDGLMRTFFEYLKMPSYKKYLGKYIFTKGEENIKAVMKSGRPCVVFSAHYGNWEMLPMVFYNTKAVFNRTYRAPNNPLVDYLFKNIRRTNVPGELLAKGSEGSKQIIRSMNSKQFIGLMADQKLSNGVENKFFGKKVTVASAMARLAIKYNALILPIRSTRFDKNKNTVEAFKAFEAVKGRNQQDSIKKTMQKITSIIEDWVKEDPVQWMWVYSRWGKFWKKSK